MVRIWKPIRSALTLARSLRIRRPRASHGLVQIICVALLCSWSLPLASDESSTTSNGPTINGEEELDAALRHAAKSALGGRDGTIILMDPRTGRVRAVVNERVAFEEAFPPGSAIKPFTLLAALRAGLIDDQMRMLCRERYARSDFEAHCAHPRFKPPFNPAQALAHSCNYYFSKIGEQLSASAFNSTLSLFGLGVRTNNFAGREATGMLPRGDWRISNALGDDPQLLVTPVQLITAYSALINGGHLYATQASGDFKPQERARLQVAPAHRALLLKGLRGAIAYGTAARAGLNSLSAEVYGKTGTSTPVDDFRTSHGWFVGFASAQNSNAQPAPESIRLAVLVFLRRANGTECAELSRPIFEEYARRQLKGAEGPGLLAEGANLRARFGPIASSSSQVRVRLAREGVTVAVSLDDYVFGVLAAEVSIEDEAEALKAHAVASRTYAIKNMRRHGRDGYDFCSSTHCQRYLHVRNESARVDFYHLLRRAITETAGEVLRDGEGRIADAYFSANCGGQTANLESLWGARAPVHLRGVRDEYCSSVAGRNWTDSMTSAQLVGALNNDPRSDVGARLEEVRIVKRDRSGRVEWIALEGERRRLLRGWDFKIIVGRTLGWNRLKSTRFDVARRGASFIFHGSGFGHGLGLCQSGAHVMAGRGASYRQILNHYFPGAGLK